MSVNKKKLRTNEPIMESPKLLHREKLSPSQWPVYFPLPENVERDNTMERLPVTSRTVLFRINTMAQITTY